MILETRSTLKIVPIPKRRKGRLMCSQETCRRMARWPCLELSQSVSQSAFIQVGEIRWFVTGGFCIRIPLSQTNKICRRASRNVMGKEPPPPPPPPPKKKINI